MDTLHQNPSAVVAFRRRDGKVAQVAGAAFLEIRQMVQTLFEDGALRMNRVSHPEDVLFYWPMVEQDSGLGEKFVNVWRGPVAEEVAEEFFAGLRSYLIGEDRVGYVHTPTVRHPLLGGTLFLETILLNTVQVAGSKLLRVLAKLAFCNRSHCYVNADDCAWLADLLERGIHTHILQPGHGWGDVIALLYGAGAVPSSVVTDAEGAEKGCFPDNCLESVARHERDPHPRNATGRRVALFPSRVEMDEREQAIRSRWPQLPYEERWDLADKAQRMPVPALNVFQLSPVLVATQSYGDGFSGFDLYAFMVENAQPRDLADH